VPPKGRERRVVGRGLVKPRVKRCRRYHSEEGVPALQPAGKRGAKWALRGSGPTTRSSSQRKVGGGEDRPLSHPKTGPSGEEEVQRPRSLPVPGASLASRGERKVRPKGHQKGDGGGTRSRRDGSGGTRSMWRLRVKMVRIIRRLNVWGVVLTANSGYD
jgi:hypothetical protein